MRKSRNARSSAAAWTSAGGGGSIALSSSENGIDEMTWSAGYSVVTPSASATTAVARPSSWRMLRDRGLHDDLGAGRLDLVAAALPHHARAVLGVLELLDQAGDLLGLVRAGAGSRARMGSHTALHSDMPLMRWAPQSAVISDGGHAPHLLAVGLEEVAGRGASRSSRRRSPRASYWSFGGRTRTHRNDRTQRTASIEPEVAQGVDRLDGVVVELALVVDAARSGAGAGTRRRSRISCQRSSTGLTLVKKRWPPMSKRQPSRSTVRLMPPTTSSASSTVRRDPGLGQLVGGGEPGGAGADDDDVADRVGLRRRRGGAGLVAHSRYRSPSARRTWLATVPKSPLSAPIPGPDRAARPDARPRRSVATLRPSCVRRSTTASTRRRTGSGERLGRDDRGRPAARRGRRDAAVVVLVGVGVVARFVTRVAAVARRGAQRQHRRACPSATCSRRSATTATRRSTTCCCTAGWRCSARATSPCGPCRASSRVATLPAGLDRRAPARPAATAARWAIVAPRPVARSRCATRTETRMYSLVMLLVLAGYLLLADALRAPTWLRLGGVALISGAPAAHPLLGVLPARPRSAAAARAACVAARPTSRRGHASGSRSPWRRAACSSCRGCRSFLDQARPHRHAVGARRSARPPSSRPR